MVTQTSNSRASVGASMCKPNSIFIFMIALVVIMSCTRWPDDDGIRRELERYAMTGELCNEVDPPVVAPAVIQSPIVVPNFTGERVQSKRWTNITRATVNVIRVERDEPRDVLGRNQVNIRVAYRIMCSGSAEWRYNYRIVPGASLQSGTETQEDSQTVTVTRPYVLCQDQSGKFCVVSASSTQCPSNCF